MTGRNRSMTVVGGAGAGLVAGFGSVLALVASMSCASKPGGSTLVGEIGENGVVLPPTGAPQMDMTSSGGAVNPGSIIPSEGGAPSFAEAMAVAGRPASELTEEDSCGEVTAETMPVTVETEVTTEMPAPVALYFVLDNSLSMEETGSDETSRWTEAVDAIKAFVNDAGSAGLSAAIQYFTPPGGNTPEAELCDGSVQEAPDAPMGLLPDNAAAIVTSLDGTVPAGFTPTPGALQGGVDYCTQYEVDNPGAQCIVLLITDGVPSQCGLSSACTANNTPPQGMAGTGAGGGAGMAGAGTGVGIPPAGGFGDCVDPDAIGVLSAIAADGTTAGVSTFAVGMEGVPTEGFALLDAIAVAGGTDCTPGAAGDEACDVTTTGPAGFLEAFNVIRETIATTEIVTETVTEALECEWVIPPPQDPEEPLELGLVNLSLTIPGADPTNIGHVSTAADCANAVDGAGWHYNDLVAPTSIVACPNTCMTIQAADMPVLNILLGCETEPSVVQ